MFKTTRKIIYISLFALIFVSCGDQREKFIAETKNGCLYTMQMDDPEKACTCVAKYVADQLTDKEIDFFYTMSKRMPNSMEERNLKADIDFKLEKFKYKNRMSNRDLKKMQEYLIKCMNDS